MLGVKILLFVIVWKIIDEYAIAVPTMMIAKPWQTSAEAHIPIQTANRRTETARCRLLLSR
ncbi:Uncharacterised protein [Bacillus licheniformis]|nr:Uncharacterised protein [Bacillus licheniformis]